MIRCDKDEPASLSFDEAIGGIGSAVCGGAEPLGVCAATLADSGIGRDRLQAATNSDARAKPNSNGKKRLDINEFRASFQTINCDSLVRASTGTFYTRRNALRNGRAERLEKRVECLSAKSGTDSDDLINKTTGDGVQK